MFTGIISSKGHVLKRRDLCLEVRAPAARLRVGDSVAVNGVCLTVVKRLGTGPSSALFFDLSQETLERTTVGWWQPGQRVNVEPALRVGEALGGHIVQGHVDGVGRVVSRQPQDGWTLFTFEFPAALGDYFVPKGSVAVDGISLTLVRPSRNRFEVAVIPHTEKMTTLGQARPGDRVNLEADVLAKQVATLLKNWRRSRGGRL